MDQTLVLAKCHQGPTKVPWFDNPANNYTQGHFIHSVSSPRLLPISAGTGCAMSAVGARGFAGHAAGMPEESCQSVGPCKRLSAQNPWATGSNTRVHKGFSQPHVGMVGHRLLRATHVRFGQPGGVGTRGCHPSLGAFCAAQSAKQKSFGAFLGDTSISILSRDPSFQKPMRSPGETDLVFERNDGLTEWGIQPRRKLHGE